MKKPQEPKNPYPPTKPYLSPQVREQVGPIEEDEDYDEPCYPDLSIGYIEKWAARNGIEDPKSVVVSFYPGNHVMKLTLEGERTITDEERAEADREHVKALKLYNEVTLPEYQEAQAKYDTDLRAYYKWKHDGVGKEKRA